MREFFESLPVRRRWIVAGAVGALLVVVVLIATLGTGEEATPTTSTSTTSTTTTTATTTTTSTTTTTLAAGSVWPLTGLPSELEEISRPILAVKIDNSSAGRPQTGLAEADLVFDILVEGGVSRLLALYQSSLPEEIGPVRSVREVDIKLLPPFHPLFAYSGGVPAAVGSLSSVAIDVGEPSVGSAYSRAGNRRPPYDLMLDPAVAVGARPEAEPGTGSWIRFETGDTEDGEAAGTVQIDASSVHRVTYGFSAADGGYLRFHGTQPHLADTGDQLVATTVVVVFVDQLETGRTDSAGSPVPDFDVVGRGEALIFRGGRSFAGRWERGRVTDFFRFFDETNREMGFSVGTTWVHVVPRGRSVTWQ